MMILDRYKENKNFPFEHYFEDITQYYDALSYWTDLIETIPNFSRAEWLPVDRGEDLEERMYLGTMFDIVNMNANKFIHLQTTSILGHANMLSKENSGYSDEEYTALVKLMGDDFELSEDARKGLSYESALEQTKESFSEQKISCWVDEYEYFQVDPQHKDGGYDTLVERLILVSEISEKEEPQAREALELFLQPGSAMERVNSVFSLDDEL